MKDIQALRVRSISQGLLAEFREIKRQMNAARERYDEVRGLVLELHRSGAHVQPGDLTFHVDRREVRRFNEKDLAAILGKIEADRLRELMTMNVQLVVSVFGPRG